MDVLQEFHDPVHGFVHYTRREIEIIDHPAFQRLFKVYQLGQTHLVFRGATHSRGQHSLGTVAAVELLIAATDKTYEHQITAEGYTGSIESRWKPDRQLDPAERAFARLAALLHDVGHLVNGHTIEDELGLLHDHGSRQRIEMILDRPDWVMATMAIPARLSDKNRASLFCDDSESISDPLDGDQSQLATQVVLPGTETLRQLIDRLYSTLAEEANVWGYVQRHIPAVDEDITRNGDATILSASEILLEIIVKDGDTSPLDQDLSTTDGKTFRVSVLRDLVGNTVCADLIDYLQRDWRHIGKPRYLDTRLLQYIEILTNGSESKVAVNLRSNNNRRPRPDVMSAILELLENRYHLWEVALLHRTKTCASAMLERAIVEKARHSGLIDTVHERVTSIANSEQLPAEIERTIFQQIEEVLFEALLGVSDTEACQILVNALQLDAVDSQLPRNSRSGLQREEDPSDYLFQQLEARNLHKEIARVEFGSYSQTVSDFLSPFKAPRIERFMAAYRRWSSVRRLEDDFELEPGSLVMYCLPFGLGKKLADVEILYGDDVRPLKDLDAIEDVSGGHLRAQLNRYDRLWRASLFASEAAKRKLELSALTGTLTATFRRAVLGLTDIDVTMYDLAKILAAKQSHITYASDAVLHQNLAVAVRGNDNANHYPTGQPTIRSHFLSTAS